MISKSDPDSITNYKGAMTPPIADLFKIYFSLLSSHSIFIIKYPSCTQISSFKHLMHIKPNRVI